MKRVNVKGYTRLFIVLSVTVLLVGNMGCASKRPKSYKVQVPTKTESNTPPSRWSQYTNRYAVGGTSATKSTAKKSVKKAEPVAEKRGWFGRKKSEKIPEPTPRKVEASKRTVKEGVAPARETRNYKNSEGKIVSPVVGFGQSVKEGERLIILLSGIQKERRVEDQVDEQGKITLPLLGKVKVAGKTPSELEEFVVKLYVDGQIYKKVDVSVIRAAQSYYIRGSVHSPGRFPYVPGMTLMRAVVTSGGTTDFANGKVEILRGDGAPIRAKLNDIKKKKAPDISILPDDVIEVIRGIL